LVQSQHDLTPHLDAVVLEAQHAQVDPPLMELFEGARHVPVVDQKGPRGLGEIGRRDGLMRGQGTPVDAIEVVERMQDGPLGWRGIRHGSGTGQA
jgi:hypothetical protein